MNQSRRARVGLLVLAGLTAFAFGALVRIALANHYHTAGACGAGNGMVHGSSTNDSAYHARVEYPSSCPPNQKTCNLRHADVVGSLGSDVTYFSTCNAFTSQGWPECAGYVWVSYEAQFAQHDHYAHNWCR